jgi:tetratricopeptide (TPR) repeat protein
MKQEILFIQYALSMNFVQQTTLVQFFQKHGYPTLPSDIDQILLQEGLITEEQRQTLHSKIANISQEVSQTRDSEKSEAQPKENPAPSLILTLSEGKIVEIPYDNETTGEIFAIAPAAASAEIEDSIVEEGIPLADSVPIGLQNITISDGFSAGQGVVISGEDSEEISWQDTITPSKQPASPCDIGATKGSEAQFYTQQRTEPSPNSDHVTERYPESCQMSLQKIQQERDALLGQMALQKNLITSQLLQACMHERLKLSAEGKYMTLGQILLHQKLINETQLAELMQECQTRRMEPAPPDLPGQELVMDKYRILNKLGSGGMGIVYKVEHTMLQRSKFFALKTMHPQFASNDTSYKRFVREVELAMGLMHKNIIAVREFGMLPSKVPYLVMDYSPGQPLDDMLKADWPCDIARSLRLLRQVLEGLSEAHQHNVVHRDLKPANLLVEQDEQGNDVVKIVDFGLAKLLQDSEQMEALTQGTIGTPLYMSPEQASGEYTDQRSDIYSAGLILYEMVLGKRPFHSNSLQKMLIKQMFEEPPAPQQVRPDLPLTVNNLILKALAKNVHERYQTAQEFIEDIDKILGGSRQAPFLTTGRSRGWSLLKIVALSLLLIALAAGIVAMLRPDYYQKTKQWLTADSAEEAKRLLAQQKEQAFTEAKRQLLGMKAQKLWQQAYVTILEMEKLTIPSEQEKKELAETKLTVSQKLEEIRIYEKTRDMAHVEQERNSYDKAISLWQSYLAQYPNSEERPNILSQIEVLQDIQRKLLQQKEQEKKLAYVEAKNKVLAMHAQKLWQEAYVMLLEIEKVPTLEAIERQEIAALKQETSQRLEESRDYQKAKEMAQSERDREAYDKAVQVWQTYLAKYPQSENSGNVVSQIESLKNAGERQLAQKHDSLVAEAKSLMQKNNYGLAAKTLLEALKYQGKNRETLLLLGNAYFSDKEYGKALQYFEACGDLSATTCYKMARSYAIQNDLERALASAQKAVAQAVSERMAADDVVDCHSLLAKIYEKKNMPTEATDSYCRAVEYIERNKLASSEYQKLYAQLGNLIYRHGVQKQEAARYWKTYKTIGGNDAKILSQLIEITDFTPLVFQKKWEYEIRVGNKQIRKTYEIAAVDQQKFMVRVDGQISENWYREGAFFVKQVGGNSDKVLQYPAKLNSQWTSTPGKQKWEYKIAELGVTVTGPAGVFRDCIKVIANETSNPQQPTYIYYAPEVGVVKEEKMRNNQIIFAKELVAYSK